MKIFENLNVLETCDHATLVKLCRHYIDVIERVLTESQKVNALMHQMAAAFTAAGTEHGGAMRLILDDIEKIGPSIVGAALPPSRQ